MQYDGPQRVAEAANRQRFQELADQWEEEAVLLSNPSQATSHAAHQEIVGMGKAAIPLILERMRAQGGRWFYALQDITKADPVPQADRGNMEAMTAAWLEWGGHNGYLEVNSRPAERIPQPGAGSLRPGR